MELDRFKVLAALGRPGATKALADLENQHTAQREDRTLDEAEDIARRLRNWARSREAREVFIERVVVPAIVTARAGVYAHMGDPARSAFYLGMQKSAEDLYEQFLSWSGQGPLGPPVKGAVDNE